MDKLDKEIKLIHELLDGELSDMERQAFFDRLNSNPFIKNEFVDLRSVVDMLESAERLKTPLTFTSQVLGRLHVRKPSLRERVSGFLFGARILTWNMATALAALCLVTISSVAFYQVWHKSNSIQQQSAIDNSTRRVSVSFYAPQARKVSLAGDFNKWSVEKNLMKKKNDGTWTMEIPLQPGIYHYMFVVDEESWVADPQAEAYRDDGFGNKNSVLRVSL